jgi:hypothetical protein
MVAIAVIAALAERATDELHIERRGGIIWSPVMARVRPPNLKGVVPIVSSWFSDR